MHSLRARRCRISGQCVVERAASRCGRVAGLWMLRHEEEEQEVLEEDVRPTWWLLLLLLRMTMSLLMLRSPARLAGGGEFVAIDEFWVGWERERERERVSGLPMLAFSSRSRYGDRTAGREEGRKGKRERERERKGERERDKI